MKKVLYLVLESGEGAFSALSNVRTQGYNATVINTESLTHAVEYFPEEHHFFNLRHLENKEMKESIYCLFITDSDKLEKLKELIRESTNNFKSVKGFMYSKDILDYEGSI